MDPEDIEAWHLGCEIWLCELLLQYAEPDHAVEAMVDSASEENEKEVRWLLSLWDELRDLSSLSIELRLAALRARLDT